MTNLDKWTFLTKDLEAPQVYIDFAWWFAVSAALERRVYFGDIARPLFCNSYVLLVGPPAIGKGTSMREARQLLHYALRLSPEGKPILNRDREPYALFHSLPDTTTFESLVWDMAECTNAYIRKDGSIYSHASAYFLLEELSSLFRKNKSEDVSRLLLNLYDCTEYEYKTRTKGKAHIRNGCLSLLAGTTLDFVRQAESAGLLGEGLFSRMFIVYADEPRHVKFNYSDLSKEQLQAQKDLREYLKKLSTLYGQIHVPPDVIKWQEDWWQEEYKRLRAYNDDKLMNFFGRRKLQVYKLAAALHYSEFTDPEIPLPTWTRAADIARGLEINVIKIARRTGKNEAFSIQEQCLKFIAQQPRTHAEVVNYLAPNMGFQEITNLLAALQLGEKIVQTPEGMWKTFT